MFLSRFFCIVAISSSSFLFGEPSLDNSVYCEDFFCEQSICPADSLEPSLDNSVYCEDLFSPTASYEACPIIIDCLPPVCSTGPLCDDSVCAIGFCRKFYIGFEGGWSNGLGRADTAKNVGQIGLNGTTDDAHAAFSTVLGAEIGCWFNAWIRMDLSYAFTNARYNWYTVYPPVNPSFAYLDSHLVLINGYWHLRQLCLVRSLLGNIDPYISGGIGAAINYLHEDREYSTVSTFLSLVTPKTHANFGARIGGGIFIPVNQRVIFDVAFYANYIGKIVSGDRRTLINPPITLPLVPFVFKNNWIASLTFGLKYHF